MYYFKIHNWIKFSLILIIVFSSNKLKTIKDMILWFQMEVNRFIILIENLIGIILKNNLKLKKF